MSKKVYIINKSGHDFDEAIPFGKLVYLSEGMMDRYAITSMFRQFSEIMKDSHEDDYILLTGLASMGSIACAIFAYKHGRLNLLVFKNNKYLERRVVIGELNPA